MFTNNKPHSLLIGSLQICLHLELVTGPSSTHVRPGLDYLSLQIFFGDKTTKYCFKWEHSHLSVDAAIQIYISGADLHLSGSR